MDENAFDRALIDAWFARAAVSGRGLPSVAAAAQDAGLSLERARGRFPSRASVLMRFGRIADQAALAGVPADVPVRDKLFDMIMRRIDVLQAHRGGVNAVLKLLPGMPPVALLLAVATERSMRWLLDASGVGTSGLTGALRVRGLAAVWLYTVRAWRTDESMDLSSTMAALDRALVQAERAAGWLGGPRGSTPPASEPQPPSSLPDPLPPDPLPPDPLPPDPLPPLSGQPDEPADGMPGLESGGV